MSQYQAVEKVFRAGDVILQSGKVLRDTCLKYLQIGELNPSRNNLIVLPTYYGGTHSGNLPLIGAPGPIDPSRY